ncbi:MAG: zf-HC2 domain-containing protein [Armatimonadetes bacterium]|nr:zf-HC2 domain-containing protein [Armatimonadota bacterium]
MRRCEAYREWMQESLEGALPAGESAELAAHLHECPGCRSEYAALQSAVSLIEEAIPVPLPFDFVGPVARRIEREASGEPTWRRWLFREGGLRPVPLFLVWLACGLALFWSFSLMTGRPPEQVASPPVWLESARHWGDTAVGLTGDWRQQGRSLLDKASDRLPIGLLRRAAPFVAAGVLADILMLLALAASWQRRRMSTHLMV